MPEPRLNLSKVKCVLADRDLFTRGLVAQMLRGFGMRSIQMANDGAQARDLIIKESPDVCIIEGALPDMPASEMINWVRQQPPPLRFVPIIILSGYTQLRLISQARD